MSKRAIPASDEAWEERLLGADESFVKVSNADIDGLVNESLELKAISIRLPISLIDDFKHIAQLHGLGYQTLMRQVLKRFAECEKKQLLREAASQVIAERARAQEARSDDDTDGDSTRAA